MRPVNVVVGAAAFALALCVAWESAPRRPVVYTEPDGAPLPDGGHASDAGGGPAASAASSPGSGGSDVSGRAEETSGMPVGDGGLPFGDLPVPGIDDLDGAASMPVLGAGAPRGVRFGVILVAYEGTELLAGEHPSRRTKADAKALADRLDDDAKSDFHGAVQRGDNGSSDDVGRVPRGVLDANTEYALFSLPVGGVSTVVDTPRGFWIAKRLE